MDMSMAINEIERPWKELAKLASAQIVFVTKRF